MTIEEELCNYAQARFADLKTSGFTHVRFLDGGKGTCPVCRALADAQVVSLDAVAVWPPKGCRCKPHCRCCFVASESPD